MEVQMQKVMQMKASNDINGLHNILKNVPKEFLQHTIDVVRSNAQKNFKDKQYKEAIENYSSILTSVAPEEKHKIWSNISLCYSELEDYDSSIESAIECLVCNEKWTKAYFRISKALNHKKAYEASIKILKKGIDTCIGSPDVSELERLLEETTKDFHYHKNIERATVDYRRFEKLAALIDLQELEAQSKENSMGIVPSNDLTPEQAKELEMMLEGKAPVEVAVKNSFVFNHSRFELDYLDDISLEGDINVQGVSRLFTMMKEVELPKALIRLSSSGLLSSWTTHLSQFLHDSSCLPTNETPLLYLGFGGGLVLSYLSTLSPLPSSSNTTTISPLDLSPILAVQSQASMLDTRMSIYQLAKTTELKEKKICLSNRLVRDLICQSTVLDSPSPPQEQIQQMAPRNCLVIDPVLLDQSVLSLIKSVRDIREKGLISATSPIYPSRVVLKAVLANTRIYTYEMKYDLLAEEREWYPSEEKLYITSSYDNLYETYLSHNGTEHCRVMSSVKEIYSFDLDCPLDKLNQELPLSASTTWEDVKTRGGFNSLILLFDIYSRHSPDGDYTLIATNDFTRRENRGVEGGVEFFGQNVYWLDKQEEKEVNVSLAIHNYHHLSVNLFNKGEKKLGEEKSVIQLQRKERKNSLNRLIYRYMCDYGYNSYCKMECEQWLKKMLHKGKINGRKVLNSLIAAPVNIMAFINSVIALRDIYEKSYHVMSSPSVALQTYCSSETVAGLIKQFVKDFLKEKRDIAVEGEKAADLKKENDAQIIREKIARHLEIKVATMQEGGEQGTKYDGVIYDGFDSIGFGSGIIQSQEYLRNASILGEEAIVCPGKLRVYATLAQVGEMSYSCHMAKQNKSEKEISEINAKKQSESNNETIYNNVEIQTPLIPHIITNAAYNDYFAVPLFPNFGTTQEVLILSEVEKIWETEFVSDDFSSSGELQDKKKKIGKMIKSKEWNVKTKGNGAANAILFFFAFTTNANYEGKKYILHSFPDGEDICRSSKEELTAKEINAKREEWDMSIAALLKEDSWLKKSEEKIDENKKQFDAFGNLLPTEMKVEILRTKAVDTAVYSISPINVDEKTENIKIRLELLNGADVKCLVESSNQSVVPEDPLLTNVYNSWKWLQDNIDQMQNTILMESHKNAALLHDTQAACVKLLFSRHGDIGVSRQALSMFLLALMS